MFLVHGGIPKPFATTKKQRKSDMRKTSGSRKKSFRIKRNKGIKKRLFSANARENSENEDRANTSMNHLAAQKSKPSVKKGHAPHLPPLKRLVESKLNLKDGPIKSSANITTTSEASSSSLRKPKPVMRKRKSKARKLTEVAETPLNKHKASYHRIKSIDSRRVPKSSKVSSGSSGINLPVHDITFKHNLGIEVSNFHPMGYDTASQSINLRMNKENCRNYPKQ